MQTGCREGHKNDLIFMSVLCYIIAIVTWIVVFLHQVSKNNKVAQDIS